MDGEVQSAGRDPIEGADALAVLEGVKDLRVARGKSALHFDLARDRPSDEELLALLLGRSGKLRAPTLRLGTTLVVGYNTDLLAEVFL
jgi:arsenate reductase-like glutaredoxin family protein